MNRIVIIGNSGSGKSTLARKLNSARGIPVVHLDELFWLPGGFSHKRPAEIANAQAGTLALGGQWIVEGVFGDLADRFLHRADKLIWLDLPWPVCKDSLLARGSDSAGQLDSAAAEAAFSKLLEWAEGYWNRSGPCSHVGHQEIFDNFHGSKQRITNRNILPGITETDGSTCGGGGEGTGSGS